MGTLPLDGPWTPFRPPLTSYQTIKHYHIQSTSGSCHSIRTMPFNPNQLASHVPAGKYSRGIRVESVGFFRDEANSPAIEDTMIKLFVLSCSNGTQSGSSSYFPSSQQGANKRFRPSGPPSSPYNRFFLVADLMNPPNCAAIMPRTVDQSARLLHYLKGAPFVGEPFYAHEPEISTETLGQYTPVLNLPSSPLLPTRTPTSHLRSTQREMRLPDRVGQANYFIITAQDIDFHRLKIAPQKTCMGTQCDRQKDKTGCTCLHASHTSSAGVYQFDVTFDVPEQFNTSKSATVPSFQSLKTTSIFFSNYDEYTSHHSQAERDDNLLWMRERWQRIVDYINDDGDGWTLVGWTMLGEHTDVANASEKVENYTTTIHLSYLQPTNPDDLTSDAFKALQIKNNEPGPTRGTSSTSRSPRPTPQGGGRASTAAPTTQAI